MVKRRKITFLEYIRVYWWEKEVKHFASASFIEPTRYRRIELRKVRPTQEEIFHISAITGGRSWRDLSRLVSVSAKIPKGWTNKDYVPATESRAKYPPRYRSWENPLLVPFYSEKTWWQSRSMPSNLTETENKVALGRLCTGRIDRPFIALVPYSRAQKVRRSPGLLTP